MKRLITVYIIFLFFPFFVIGQNSNIMNDSVACTKHQFSLTLGGHYTHYSGDAYIEPQPISPSSSNIDAGFTIISNFDVQFGAHYSYIFKTRFFFITGLLYFNRRSILVTDSILARLYNTNEVIKYNTSSNSIQLPLYLGFKYYKVGIFMGTKINLLNIYRTEREFINGSKDIIKYGHTQPKKIFYPGMYFNYS
ncbi:MAG: hypothetical protein ABII90_05995, partial [Bacteroidota bacterium]